MQDATNEAQASLPTTQAEAYYDEQVAHRVQELAEACAARNMGFLCVIDLGNGSLGVTARYGEGASSSLLKANVALYAQDVEQYAEALASHQKEDE